MNTFNEDNLTGINHGELFANKPLRYLTAGTIIGDKVHNDKNEHLGRIKDIMIHITSGTIDYFIIEFGGFSRHRDKIFCHSLQAFAG